LCSLHSAHANVGNVTHYINYNNNTNYLRINTQLHTLQWIEVSCAAVYSPPPRATTLNMRYFTHYMNNIILIIILCTLIILRLISRTTVDGSVSCSSVSPLKHVRWSCIAAGGGDFTHYINYNNTNNNPLNNTLQWTEVSRAAVYRPSSDDVGRALRLEVATVLTNEEPRALMACEAAAASKVGLITVQSLFNHLFFASVNLYVHCRSIGLHSPVLGSVNHYLPRLCYQTLTFYSFLCVCPCLTSQTCSRRRSDK
jgi:hypothetical protein